MNFIKYLLLALIPYTFLSAINVDTTKTTYNKKEYITVQACTKKLKMCMLPNNNYLKTKEIKQTKYRSYKIISIEGIDTYKKIKKYKRKRTLYRYAKKMARKTKEEKIYWKKGYVKVAHLKAVPKYRRLFRRNKKTHYMPKSSITIKKCYTDGWCETLDKSFVRKSKLKLNRYMSYKTKKRKADAYTNIYVIDKKSEKYEYIKKKATSSYLKRKDFKKGFAKTEYFKDYDRYKDSIFANLFLTGYLGVASMDIKATVDESRLTDDALSGSGMTVGLGFGWILFDNIQQTINIAQATFPIYSTLDTTINTAYVFKHKLKPSVGLVLGHSSLSVNDTPLNDAGDIEFTSSDTLVLGLDIGMRYKFGKNYLSYGYSFIANYQYLMLDHKVNLGDEDSELNMKNKHNLLLGVRYDF